MKQGIRRFRLVTCELRLITYTGYFSKINSENIQLSIISNQTRYDNTINFNWNSLHAGLDNHYDVWSCKKKLHKKIKAYRKSV